MVDVQAMMIVIGFVVLGMLGLALIGFMMPKAVFHFMKGPLEGRIAARYRPDEILMQDLKALSFGVESAGVWQLRGNGGLVLTEKELHFFMFLPESHLCVPLEAISEVTITKKHLGKATLNDLLKVQFVAEGKMDSVAWYLADPRAWQARLESLRGGGVTLGVKG